MEFEKIRDVIAEQLGKSQEEIKMETHFTNDLKADSLDMMQIVSALEEIYGMEFPEEAFGTIKTVGDAVDFTKKAVNI